MGVDVAAGAVAAGGMFDEWGGLRAAQPVAHATVAALLAAMARRVPDTELIVAEDGRATYGEMARWSAEYAARLLAAGCGKGTHVGVQFPNGVRCLVRWLACARIGAVPVPINVFLKGPELRHVLVHADIQLLLTATDAADEDYLATVESALPELARQRSPYLLLAGAPYLRGVWTSARTGRPWAVHDADRDGSSIDGALLARVEEQVTPSDVAVIIYTSGSTADPKGVVLSHGSLVRHSANVSVLQKITPEDRFYSLSPFFWIGGLVVTLLSVMHAGATVLTHHRFSADRCLDFLAAERATVVRLYPNARRALEEHRRFAEVDLSRVRAGLDWPKPDPDRMMRSHGALGMTETCGPHIYSAQWPPPFPAEFPGSHGPPVPGVEHKIVDDGGRELPDGEVGEILVRGYMLMQGLYKREREDVFETGGWYRTGDLGCLQHGVLYFRGRLKHVIKSAGANISPEEVEQALLDQPEVEKAFVLGLPAGDRGEDVVAAVVTQTPTNGAGGVEGEELRARLRARLAGFKVPRYIAVLTPQEVPIMASGDKLDTRTLRTLIATRWHPTSRTGPAGS
jgi:acyl-CoA synthetase (AMP-forming)/AMP-acid ligase II